MTATTPIPCNVHILPPLYRGPAYARSFAASHQRGRWTTVDRLFEKARVRFRATMPAPRRIYLRYGRTQIRTPDADIVSVPVKNLQSRLAALRALEILAYGFHMHACKHSLSGRGLFSAPL